MRLTVTGADGFIGRAVVRKLITEGVPPYDLLLVDRAFAKETTAHRLVGDLTDERILTAAMARCDALLHLAALPGGAAQADPRLSRRINVDVPMRLIERMEGRRLILAGSIAVLGGAPAGPVDDMSPPRPDSVYGTHKAMVELAFGDAVRRGAAAGALLRLPGVVARPASAGGFGSAWMSDIFHAARTGRPTRLPVGRGATSWLASVEVTARNLVHALCAGFTVAEPVTLPALRARIGDLTDYLSQRFGYDGFTHEEDPVVRRMFGTYPPLSTPLAERLGFARDNDLPALVDAVLDGMSDEDGTTLRSNE